MAYTQSPNMGLLIPTIGQELSPAWASDLNVSLSVIDAHNHTPGSGMLVPVSGLNINADLPLGGNNLVQARSLRMQVQSSVANPTDLGCLYVQGVDLYFNDVNGHPIQITKSQSVFASSSGISSGTASAAFSAGVLQILAASLTPANVECGSISLGNNISGSHYVTLMPPNAMATSYTLGLPALPVSTSFLTLDPTSGNITASLPVSQGIGTGNIAPNNITNSLLAWMPADTIKGNNTAGNAAPIDLTVAQTKAMLNSPPNIQPLYGSSTYSVPTGALYLMLRMIGGGGQAGGDGGGGTTGGNGTATTFSGTNVSLSAGGGAGGTPNDGSGGTGGVASVSGSSVTTILSFHGQKGGDNIDGIGGLGGASLLGYGGNNVWGNGSIGINGGGGAGSAAGGAGGGGGGGAGGYIEVMITNLAASYSYSVGNGGSGGNGTGLGGAGILIVTAYFQ